jgi:hypothetical protein
MNRCLELCLDYLTCLEFFLNIAKHVRIASNACCYFFNIRSAMVSKHSELVKRQARDHYGRFTSPSSRTAPPPSHQEVGSSSRCDTAPPPSCI